MGTIDITLIGILIRNSALMPEQ